MDRYTIGQAYPWQKPELVFELEITSENLIYTELGKTHSGVQVMNEANEKLIHQKLRQVADLIREIDKLNNETSIHQPQAQVQTLFDTAASQDSPQRTD